MKQEMENGAYWEIEYLNNEKKFLIKTKIKFIGLQKNKKSGSH